jgi:hypothetical protein
MVDVWFLTFSYLNIDDDDDDLSISLDLLQVPESQKKKQINKTST